MGEGEIVAFLGQPLTDFSVVPTGLVDSRITSAPFSSTGAMERTAASTKARSGLLASLKGVGTAMM